MVSYLNESLHEKVMDANLEITKELLKLNVMTNNGILSTEHSLHTSYSVGFPQIIMHYSDCKRLIIIFDDHKQKVTLQCLSRTSRDLIVMCMRVFSIESYLLHSKALESISSGQPPYGKIDMAIELHEVILQMNYLASDNAELKHEKARHKKEVRDMEKEMQNTIEAYRALLDCNNYDQKTGVDEEIEKVKYELNIAIENKQNIRIKLKKKKEEIKCLKKNIEEMKESQQNLVWELKESKELVAVNNHVEENKKFKDMETEIQAKNEEYLEAMSKINMFNAKIREFEDKLTEKISENNILRNEIVEHSSILQELSQSKSQNEALLGQRMILSKKIETLSNENSDLIEKIEKEQEKSRENCLSLEEENKKLRNELESLKEERKIDGNAGNLKQAQDEIIKYRQQCDNLAAQLSRMQAQLRKNK